MNKSIIYILLLSTIGFLNGCATSDPAPTNVLTQETIDKITAYGTSQKLTFTRSADDIFYAVTKTNPSGRVPKQNEYVKLYYTYTKLDGTILDSTATNQKIPVAIPYLAYNSLLNYAVAYMKEGESAVVVFPATSSSSEPSALNITLLSTRDETEQMNEYIAEKYKGFTFKKTASGLQYLLTKMSASGDTVKINKTATVSYTGRLLYKNKTRDSNGFPIYTDQFDAGSFSFMIGAGTVVSGFEEATKLMKSGDKGIFIFPSAIGYKERGSINNSTGQYSIAPYTPLLFEIEVTAVK
ncbi:MAG: FKBP-type peptidyl-prolyl cis-trans isomerase [Arcicella sp.]|nr:FKBP-type peptidyl-prolyl cis-trans isomerase [Arcicella sp.]